MEAVSIFWLVIGIICVAAIYFRNARTVSRYQVLQAMIEKGQPVTTDIFDERLPRRRLDARQSFIAMGILLIGLGCGAAIFFTALTMHEVDEPFLPFLSAFPFCLGIACLVIGRVLKPND